MSEMNLPKLIERFGSEEKCRAYLEELRWPDGVRCPRCDSEKVSRIKARSQFECSKCRYQFSVTAGTIMHDSHLPLWKWFLAIYLIVESKKGISAKQLQRMLRVSYKTAWYLAHRIRDAMGDAEQKPLIGIIEADETWHGGKQHDTGRGPNRPLYRKQRKLDAFTPPLPAFRLAEDGAVVEPSGRNRWQPVANRTALKTAQRSENRCRRLRPVATEMPW